ncbi:amidase [Paracoccus sp. MKU1]|uniref:amidase n=1 Tax=Paracoccus sp. MKU1 TaxID=1745182 RepID=UPI00071942C1|nr:amidase [Paracoccus sp. MKU1]KRW95252.1 glutamyl-tRNA amidotransferase [Paracoccus sp. MKU1]
MLKSHQNTASTAIISACSLGAGRGPRVAVKDCIDIAGLPTRCGSAAYENAVPAGRHADVVENLLDAGCHIVGKANMHELAYGMTGVNGHFGTPLNPCYPDCIPGGSSSGSAVAVAAGLVDFAVGTDTGGSIRQPAVCCGVFGLKPTFGRISRRGAYPATSSLDCIGPFARTVGMIETAMAAMDPDFHRAECPDAPRLARIKVDVDARIGQAVLFPLLEQEYPVPYVSLPGMDEAFRAGMVLIARETAAAFGPLLDEGRPLGADVRERLANARRITDAQVAEAEKIRRHFTAAVDAALEGCDAILTPALPVVPPTLAEAADPQTILPLTRYLRPFNLSGHPAIVLPVRTADGLPAGLQIVARKGDDARLCAVAAWICETVPKFQAQH